MEIRSNHVERSQVQSWNTVYDSPYFDTCNGGTTGDHSSRNTNGTILSDIRDTGMVGYDIPNFHRRKNSGELLPFTPWKQWDISGKANPGQTVDCQWTHDNTSTYSRRARTTGVPWAYPLVLKELEDLANERSFDPFVAAAAASIYSKSFDATTFVAELGQVARMLKGFTKRFAANVASGRLENPYLEARYGWRILYYDMLDIQRTIGRIDDKRKRYVEKAGVTFDDTVQHDIVDHIAPGDISLYAGVVGPVTDTVRVGVRGTVAADTAIPLVRTNVVTTAWELLTLSFVIDWIIGVGTWLESLSLLTMTQNVVAAGGFHVEVNRDYSIPLQLHPDFEPTRGLCSLREVHSGSVSGSYSGSLTIRKPASVPKFPQINVRLSELKILDLIALTLQRVRK